MVSHLVGLVIFFYIVVGAVVVVAVVVVVVFFFITRLTFVLVQMSHSLSFGW